MPDGSLRPWVFRRHEVHTESALKPVKTEDWIEPLIARQPFPNVT